MATYSAAQIKMMKEAQAIMKALNIDAEKQADIQQDILDGVISTNQELRYNLDIIRRHVKEENDLAKAVKQQADSKQDIKDLTSELLRPLQKAKTLTQDQLDIDLDRIRTAKELGIISEDESKRLTQQLKTLEKMSSNPIVKKGFETAANTIDELQSGIDSFMDKLPGGKQLSKLLGLDSIGTKLETAIASGVNPAMIAIGAALAGALLIGLKVLKELTDQAYEFAEATGVTFSQARAIADEARNTAGSLGLQLSTSKDILKIQEETLKEFGTTAMLSTETAAQVSEIGKAFGYGAQQAALVNNQFMSMGMTGADAAKAQEELAFNALKAGVNVGTVMKDISANAKSTAKYFGGNVKALAAAAVEAAKLGVSLGTMTKVADKLLDIESSLTAQFEFQAVSGRLVNFDLARQLALEGDIAGATKQIMEQVGDINDFNNMTYLQKKKLAEATGMEVDELQRSLTIQSQLSELTDEEKAKMSALNVSTAELANMTAEQARTRLADQQTLEKANAAFDAMKGQLMSAILPLGTAFADIIASLAPALKIFGKLLKPVLFLVESIAAPFKFIGAIIDKISEGVSALTEKFSFLQPTIDVISTIFSKVFEVLSSIGGILGGVLIPYLGVLAVKAATGAYKMIAQAIANIFSTFAAIPFGLGIPLAFGAVGGLIALVSKFTTKTGDLAMGANGGPIVTNPREGTIFQGTKNDEVAMGPGVINAAQGVGGTTVVQQESSSDAVLIQETNNLLRQLLQAARTPAPVQIGDTAIERIGSIAAAKKSYGN